MVYRIMAKIQYYRLDDVLKVDALYNILLGMRANGKSYSVKEHALKEAIQKNACTFVLLKRLAEDLKHNFIDEYFSDMPIDKWTKGKYNYISGYSDGIYLSNISDEGKIERGVLIGKAMCLANYERYKSREYPEVTTIIYEEFVTHGLYLRDEPRRLMDLVSTIFRRRKGKVFMIANTISRVCPFFQEWNLHNIPNMQESQIDTYVFHENEYDVKIAVEMCKNSTEKSSGMFFGNYAKSIDSGHWETKIYNKLSDIRVQFNECKTIYTLGLLSNGFGFMINLIQLPTKELAVYIYPARKKGVNEYRLPERKICDTFSLSPRVSKTLKLEIPAEDIISRLFKDDKVLFATNLVGADFETATKNMTKYPF